MRYLLRHGHLFMVASVDIEGYGTSYGYGAGYYGYDYGYGYGYGYENADGTGHDQCDCLGHWRYFEAGDGRGFGYCIGREAVA